MLSWRSDGSANPVVSHRGQGVVEHTFNPSTCKAEVGGSPWIQDHSELYTIDPVSKGKRTTWWWLHSQYLEITHLSFNPNTMEVETGRVMAWQREDSKSARNGSSGHSVWGFVETGSCPFWSEDSVKVSLVSGSFTSLIFENLPWFSILCSCY